MMRPSEGSEKTGMEGYTEGHWSVQRVPSMNDFHIPVFIREMNAPLSSPFRDALRSVTNKVIYSRVCT